MGEEVGKRPGIKELVAVLRTARADGVLPGNELHDLFDAMGFPRLADFHRNCTQPALCFLTQKVCWKPGVVCFLDCADPHRWLAEMERTHSVRHPI